MKCVSVCLRVCLWGLVVGAVTGAGARAPAGQRYEVATPHSPLLNRHKYIPLHYGESNADASDLLEEDTEVEDTRPNGLAPSELILTVFRTALDVVRGINARKKAAAKPVTSQNATALTIQSKNLTKLQSARGFDDYYDEHHHHHETTTTTTPKPPKQSRYTDPWAGYYDFIINEGSFKFWSAFQLFTTAVLFYACLSAIYYSKFNPIIPDYDREYDDYFLERTVGRKTRSLDSWHLPSGLDWMNSRTFQFIMDAISKNYETS